MLHNLTHYPDSEPTCCTTWHIILILSQHAAQLDTLSWFWANMLHNLTHYPDSEPTSLCSYSLKLCAVKQQIPILVFDITWPGFKHMIYHWYHLTRVLTHEHSISPKMITYTRHYNKGGGSARYIYPFKMVFGTSWFQRDIRYLWEILTSIGSFV
jgi:hypothetical protein